MKTKIHVTLKAEARSENTEKLYGIKISGNWNKGTGNRSGKMNKATGNRAGNRNKGIGNRTGKKNKGVGTWKKNK